MLTEQVWDYDRETDNVPEWDGVLHEPTKPTARKDYVCNYCHQPIEKGTKYIRQTGIDRERGKWFVARFHIQPRRVEESCMAGEFEYEI